MATILVLCEESVVSISDEELPIEIDEQLTKAISAEVFESSEHVHQVVLKKFQYLLLNFKNHRVYRWFVAECIPPPHKHHFGLLVPKWPPLGPRYVKVMNDENYNYILTWFYMKSSIYSRIRLYSIYWYDCRPLQYWFIPVQCYSQ